MTPGIVEYVALRLVRRYLFTEGLLSRFGQYLPHYRANANQSNPAHVVDAYATALERIGPLKRTTESVLEIGSGATNSVGYEILRRGIAGQSGRVFMYEPYASFGAQLDAQMLRKTIDPGVATRVERITTLAGVAGGSIDLILSSSVLEHVADMDGLLGALRTKMSPTCVMVHAVDYRDHFFKYPYHFLLFGETTWQRWLNPGDLPRWRLGDHMKIFRAHGFSVEILSSETNPAEYAKVRAHISLRFDRDDPLTAITRAVIACRAHSTMQHP